MLSVASYLGLAVVCWISYQWYTFTVTRAKLSSIPTVGADGFVTAYLSAWKFIFAGHKMIQEGYDKYYGAAFKVPTLETSSRWLVVVTGPKLIEELRNAGDETLSNYEFNLDLLQAEHIFGGDARVEPYHHDVVRTGLTRSLSSRFPDIADEIFQSFEQYIPATEEWKSFPILKTLIPIVCRTSNRLFVDLPLCRNPEYLNIQENFAVHVMVAASIVNLCPTLLKPFVGRLITKVPQTMKKLKEYTTPIITERLEMERELGKRWEGRPNDLLSWLLDNAPEQYRTVHDLTLRIMVINFAAIHTTSITLTNALLALASYPEYTAPLREEVEGVIASHGWTKESMGKMRKLDSFLKESVRMAGISGVSLARKAVKDFTFSNGLTIPAGCSVGAASSSTHHDPSTYEDAETFKGFRFAEMRDSGSDDLAQFRHQMISPEVNYLPFGYGRHACPGRFFAVNEVKAMTAHILLNYDIKLPEGQTTEPAADWFGTQRVPNRSAQILFRKRQHMSP